MGALSLLTDTSNPSNSTMAQIPGGGRVSRGRYPYPLETPELAMETEPGYWNSQQRGNMPPGELERKTYTYPTVEMAYQCARSNGVLPPIARIVIRESIHTAVPGQFDDKRPHCTVRFFTQADPSKFYTAHVRCVEDDPVTRKGGFHWEGEDVFWPPAT